MTAGGRSAPIVEEQTALRRGGDAGRPSGAAGGGVRRVAAETGQLLEADFSLVSRYDADGTATVVGTWARTGANPFPAGPAGGTGRPERAQPGVPDRPTGTAGQL